MRKILIATMLAMLAISAFCFIPSIANAETEYEKVWVRMHGIITHWGTDPVFGWLNVNTRKVNVNGTIHKWAMVHAVWSPEPRRLNCSKPLVPENVTFTFYSAKLTVTQMVRFNYSGYDFYVSGLWNVFNISTTILFNEYGELISFTRTITPVVTNATGELRVFSQMRQFELAITGINVLSGYVVGWIIRIWEIKLFDLDDDGKVDLIELMRVAKRYRTMPGMWNYDQELDFNLDDKIDIGDLTTIAANIEG